MNINECMQHAAKILKDSDIETPALEAGVMLSHVLKCGRAYLFAHGERELSRAEQDLLDRMTEQRAAGIPLQYILGETEFMSLTFKVSPAVLIPRQDTELLVEKCIGLVNGINFFVKKELPVRVLDMCTGSGCIAVSIAHYCPESVVVACDVSRDALDIAKANSELNGTRNRVEFRHGDLFSSLDSEQRFEIITSNPPYIESAVIAGLQREVRDHEPMLALDGGADGLEFYRKIIRQAPDYLKEHGWVVLEIGYNQGSAVAKLMEDRFCKIEIVRDLANNDRVVAGQLAL